MIGRGKCFKTKTVLSATHSAEQSIDRISIGNEQLEPSQEPVRAAFLLVGIVYT